MTLAKLEALLAAATPGEWWQSDLDGTIMAGQQPDHIEVGQTDMADSDVSLILSMRNALPALLRVARAAEAWRDAEAESDTTDCTCGSVDGEDCPATPVIARAEKTRAELHAALAALDKDVTG